MQRAEPTELFDLRMSEEARPLYDRVVRFLEDVFLDPADVLDPQTDDRATR